MLSFILEDSGIRIWKYIPLRFKYIPFIIFSYLISAYILQFFTFLKNNNENSITYDKSYKNYWADKEEEY